MGRKIKELRREYKMAFGKYKTMPEMP